MTQVKALASTIIAKLNGEAMAEPFFVNTCHRVAPPGWAISRIQVHRVGVGKLVYFKEAGG